MGQGAGDSCNCWVIGTDSMATVYTSGANRWIISLPSTNNTTKQDLKAFINNINLFIGQPENKMEEELLAMAQADINCWHGILQATGGELNTKKCFWSDFNLKYDLRGTPNIQAKKPKTPNST